MSFMSLKSSSSSNLSYNPYLFPAPQLSRHLRHVTLEMILAGHTCSPIGLADFEAYLSFVERSLENLQFVVWYQSYRQRFFALPTDVRALSPGKEATEFGFNQVSNPSFLGKRMFGIKSFGQATTQSSTTEADLTYHDDPLRSPAVPITSEPTSRESQQPFRDECERIVATFFSPNTRKELSIASNVRNVVLGELVKNTHPDVFLPAYEAVFNDLQTYSLPRFLTAASAVTCRPNQVSYVTAGMTWLLITAAVFAATYVFSPWDDFRARAFRLISVFPFVMGTGFIYAAWRGYCINISGRKKRMQLRSWEFEAAGKSSSEWWGSFVAPPLVQQYKDEEEEKVEDAEEGNADSGSTPDGALPARLARIAARQARKRREAMLVDVSAPAPFTGDSIIRHDAVTTMPELGKAGRLGPRPVMISFTQHTVVTEDDTQSIRDHKDVDGFRTYDDDASTTPSERRPRRSSSTTRRSIQSSLPSTPVYGPEKVVLDPRIVAVHLREMHKVFIFCFGIVILGTIVCLAIPVTSV